MMLAEYGEDFNNSIFGMNAFPTFIDRPVVELSLRNGRDFDELADLMDDLGLKYEIVEDRIGMVTPRVVCMIINEAAFTYGEGTAGVEEIDQAMKLGTNYPQGPFKWADMIGIGNVVAVVGSMLIDSGDGKYKIAPALKAAMLNNTRFYS
jgi:3-hydroxybutyryl-CoA dehydrogenase